MMRAIVHFSLLVKMKIRRLQMVESTIAENCSLAAGCEAHRFNAAKVAC